MRYVDKTGPLQTKLADIVQLKHGHAVGVKDGVIMGLKTVGVNTEMMTSKLV